MIGIVAGMGPHSTGPFIDLVIRECEVQYGAKHDIDYPKIAILSLPAPFYPDRPIDHPSMLRVLSQGVGDLARFGCGFIAIACNTAHIYHAHLARAVHVPVLDMVEIGVAALPTHTRSVSLIASRATVESGIYQERLTLRGVQTAHITWQQQVDELIGSARLTAAEREELWNGLISQVRGKGPDSILLACADLTVIDSQRSPQPGIVDSTRCLAAAIVKAWLET